jgi:hypothetical protein
VSNPSLIRLPLLVDQDMPFIYKASWKEMVLINGLLCTEFPLFSTRIDWCRKIVSFLYLELRMGISFPGP